MSVKVEGLEDFCRVVEQHLVGEPRFVHEPAFEADRIGYFATLHRDVIFCGSAVRDALVKRGVAVAEKP